MSDLITADVIRDNTVYGVPQMQYTVDGDSGMDEVRRISRDFCVENLHFIKPGIGEATRVLLRRVPWQVLVHSLEDYDHLGHIYQLAQEKNVPIVEYPLKNYRACGLIKAIADA